MYRNTYQRGMLTVFFGGGSKPLGIWDAHIGNGYLTRFLDQDIKAMVLEIGGSNVSTSYITCPKGKAVLGIKLPFLVMLVKNMKKYFSFEVTILDDTSTRRRFRVSNFQSSTQILPLCTVMPIALSDGWNQIQFNLAEFTRRAYKKQYVEVLKLKINANIRLRRIYFAEKLVPDDELPPEYKLYFPLEHKGIKDKNKPISNIADKENIKDSIRNQVNQMVPQEIIKPTSVVESNKSEYVEVSDQGALAKTEEIIEISQPTMSGEKSSIEENKEEYDEGAPKKAEDVEHVESAETEQKASLEVLQLETPPASVQAVVTPPSEAQAVVTPPAEAQAVVRPPAEAQAVETPPAEAQAAVTPPAEAEAVVTPPAEAEAVVTPPAEAQAVETPAVEVEAQAV